ncbi:hypothetical protein CBR_g40884 [Chara braunii]|uniref:Uncharacterized protein n=1 Tax=Chara braunii TaxID=69332 RepID=A0A388K2A2_CHABU|nr:hypothetical protein CBR_g40884 [Chara braunii]|eukprot:GBG64184.1 hypothetical protein CBR_g40884 [Chara braunii]
MENMPTKGVTFAQTRALALQTGGPDAKAHLLEVLEKLGKGVPGSHLEKQFGDEDGREFMSPDKGKSIRFEENRNTEENEEENTLCRTSTEMNIGIKARTAEEPEQGEFWVSSIRFEEDPNPNDSLTVGVSSIRFESCEEDSDAALVCAKKVSEESDENEADNTSLDNKVSPRGEGPKVIQETWVDRTMTMKMITIDEEHKDLKSVEDAQDELIGDQYGKDLLGEVLGAEISQAFEVMNELDDNYGLTRLFETVEPDDIYGLVRLFETVESDGRYELAQLFETVESDVSYELTQLFENPDLDTSCKLAQPFESVDPDVGYKLAQFFETVESDVSNELAQLFGAIEHDDDYDLAQVFYAFEPDIDYGLTQLFEAVDKYENDVENSLKTTMGRNLATTKDIEDSRMDQCKLISLM